MYETIPNELKAIAQWSLWKAETRPNGKINKPPCDSRGYYLKDWCNPENLLKFDDAVSLASSNPGIISGIGFVFTANLGLVGIDFDSVIENGEILSEYGEWIGTLRSYTEISYSGTGVHIIVKGALPGKSNRIENVEMYTEKRFFVFTGNTFRFSEIVENQSAIELLYRMKIQKIQKEQREEIKTQKKKNSLSLCSNVLGNPGNWEEIRELIERSKIAGKFFQLWNGNISGYSSQSEADLALCSMLAFYTQDAAQIESIFSMSGLNRDKWSVENYRKRTITQAINGLLGKYDWSKKTMTTNIISLDEKLSKRLVKKEEKKEIEIVFIGVLAISEKAYQISLDAKQIGLDGVVSVWVPKSAILNYDEEKSSFLLPEWLVKSFPKDAKKI